MNIWFISDLHLFHENMLRGGKIGIRPFDHVYEMHERIADEWAAKVKPLDKVYMLGDLTLERRNERCGPVHDFVRLLPGQKRLLKGNHDHLANEVYRAMGFEKVLAYREMAGILFSHIPVHPGQFYRFRGNVHGHAHESIVMRDQLVIREGGAALFLDPKPDERYINVCVEPRNYIPMSFDEIVAHYDALEKS